jgi:hypothetical protein
VSQQAVGDPHLKEQERPAEHELARGQRTQGPAEPQWCLDGGPQALTQVARVYAARRGGSWRQDMPSPVMGPTITPMAGHRTRIDTR